MNFKTILVSQGEKVGKITLNRPDKLNALTPDMAFEIAQAIDLLTEEKAVGVIVVTGMGRAFCAGGDIDNMETTLTPVDQFVDLRDHANKMAKALHTCRKPTIAMVNGPAVGAGFSIALACDMIFASSGATFGQVFIRVGLHSDCGSTFFLPRRIGTARACELIFTGDIISAQKAYEMGILNRIFSPEQLEKETEKIALKIANGPPIVLSLVKESIYRAMDHNLNTLLTIEGYAQSILTQTQDHKEGVQAFLEKRKPVFKGK